MQALKDFVLYYVNNLYLVDFMLILLVFFLFICTLLLCVFLRHRPLIALFIIALDIVASFLIFIYGYRFIDGEARARKMLMNPPKIIASTGALVVDFELENLSNFNFKECKITAKIYEDPLKDDNFLDIYKKKFVVLRKKSVSFKDLKKGSIKAQRIAFENFAGSFGENNFSVKLSSECF